MLLSTVPGGDGVPLRVTRAGLTVQRMGAGEYDDPNCPEARAGLDEADPQEEADVARCDTPMERCEFRLGDLDGEGAQESEFTIMDELQEQMRVEPIRVIADPEDGLPHPITGDTHFAPPFTYETMVCIEDERTYVEVFEEEMETGGWSRPGSDPTDREQIDTIFGSYLEPEHGFVHLTWDEDTNKNRYDCSRWIRAVDEACAYLFTRSRYDGEGKDNKRAEFSPERVEVVGSQKCVRVISSSSKNGFLVPVRPIRERCKHYKRMCVANDDQPDRTAFLHFIRFRNCMARRSVGGAFLSLRDEAVYACDYREPPDPVSLQEHLDGPDRKKLLDRPDLVKLPLFGLEGDDKNEK